MIRTRCHVVLVLVAVASLSHALDEQEIESKVKELGDVIMTWTSTKDALDPGQEQMVTDLINHYAPESIINLQRRCRRTWTSPATTDELELIQRLLESEASPPCRHFGAILIVLTPGPLESIATVYIRAARQHHDLLVYRGPVLDAVQHDRLLEQFYDEFVRDAIAFEELGPDLGPGTPLRMIWADLVQTVPLGAVRRVARTASQQLLPADWAQFMVPVFQRILREQRQAKLRLDSDADNSIRLSRTFSGLSAAHDQLYSKHAVIRMFHELQIRPVDLIHYLFDKCDRRIDARRANADPLRVRFHNLYITERISMAEFVAHCPDVSPLVRALFELGRHATETNSDSLEDAREHLLWKSFLGELHFALLNREDGSCLQSYWEQLSGKSQDLARHDLIILFHLLHMREIKNSCNQVENVQALPIITAIERWLSRSLDLIENRCHYALHLVKLFAVVIPLLYDEERTAILELFENINEPDG